jgi:hypothetical protein
MKLRIYHIPDNVGHRKKRICRRYWCPTECIVLLPAWMNSDWLNILCYIPFQLLK